MKVIGLTGGIGSGKSTFCDLMAEHGIATIDTDQIARQVVEPNSEGLKQVVAEFGSEILQPDGTLNRTALRNVIFGDPNNQIPRQKLEAILHPLIQTETKQQISDYRNNPEYHPPLLLVAIPLLVEGILKKGHKPEYIDEVWVLDCSQETQIERASLRDGVSLQQIQNILANQASREQRLQYADKVVTNNSTLENLKNEVKSLIDQKTRKENLTRF